MGDIPAMPRSLQHSRGNPPSEDKETKATEDEWPEAGVEGVATFLGDFSFFLIVLGSHSRVPDVGVLL